MGCSYIVEFIVNISIRVGRMKNLHHIFGFTRQLSSKLYINLGILTEAIEVLRNPSYGSFLRREKHQMVAKTLGIMPLSAYFNSIRSRPPADSHLQ